MSCPFLPEIPRHDVSHTVRFFGSVEDGPDGKKKWVGGETVEAVAYDVPIPGYKTKNVISLRLWQATAPAPDFDLFAFNAGEHDKAAHAQTKAEEVNRRLWLTFWHMIWFWNCWSDLGLKKRL